MNPCTCWRCRTSRGLRLLEGATEEALEESADFEECLAWLSEEVDAVLAQPWWKPWRARLRKARRAATPMRQRPAQVENTKKETT